MEFPSFIKPKPKQEFTEEALLKEIEKETGALPKPMARANMPPPPVVQKPAARFQMPSEQQRQAMGESAEEERQPMLEKEDVTKLPLFMKVEEYDKTVFELNRIADSLKKMDEILANLTALERQQSEQTSKWKSQLEATKTQLKQLLSHMPESGKLKDLVETKKRQQQSEKISREAAESKKATSQKIHSFEMTRIQSEVGVLKGEMQSLREGLKDIAELIRQKQEQEKKQPTESIFPRAEYKKVDTARPW